MRVPTLAALVLAVSVLAAAVPAAAFQQQLDPPPPRSGSPASDQPQGRTEQQIRDSLRALYRAVTALKILDSRVRMLEAIAEDDLGENAEAIGACEIVVADFCFGPRNGSLGYGAFGTKPFKRRYALERYATGFENRINLFNDRYIDTVRHFLKTIPNDRFLNMELIRDDLDQGDYVSAFESILRCPMSEWFCAAMRGHSMVLAGARQRADTVWSKALALMPPNERCAWLDPTWVSDSKEFNKAYRAASCPERIRMAERVWWLSDPLYSVPGNERRSEHLARLMELMVDEGYPRMRRMTPAMILRSKPIPVDSTVTAVLDGKLQLRHAPWLLTYRWGFTEAVMRAGPPHFRASNGTGLTLLIYPHPRLSFVPSAAVFLDHLNATAADWSLHKPLAFEFMNFWHEPIRELESQVAWFRRGDSARVVAAADLAGDSLLTGAQLQRTLFLQRDYDRPLFRSAGWGDGIVRFAQGARPESTLASIELVAPGGASGRTRFGTGPPPMEKQRLALSDILLMEPRQNLPADLEAATERALGRTTLASRANVSLFWEMYGLTAGEAPEIEVLATRQRGSLLGGLLRAITSRDAVDSLGVTWVEAPVAGLAQEPRSLTLNLSTLAPGDYTLVLSASVPGQNRATVRRKIVIERPRR